MTLVEYGDYECPYCGAAQPVIERVQARFSRELRLVFRHFPLVEVHPHSGPAAETAEFAGGNGLFWSMHDALFANQRRLSVPLMIALASSLNLSTVALRDALASGLYAGKVRADFAGGVRSGVNGTPTFFINGARYDSPNGVFGLGEAIDRLLLATTR
ncbi:DsbA family protein [Methylopila sp. 73B]|uniref:DsbA family protein n=1 Tax=Methylopila sp. 73B TaxID=1120792 RepID=UPI000370C613|nr:DsbA family protein [Methylopila sp. 73B]